MPNQESAKSLTLSPFRYHALISTIEQHIELPTEALVMPVSRLMARRVRAQHVLRKSLLRFWEGTLVPEFGSVRPYDLILYFKEYAESLYAAAAEAFSDFFSNEDRFGSFLGSIRQWTVAEILPPKDDEAPLTIEFYETLSDFEIRHTTSELTYDFPIGDFEGLLEATLSGARLKKRDCVESRTCADYLVSALRSPSNRHTAQQILWAWLEEQELILWEQWWERPVILSKADEPTKHDEALSESEHPNLGSIGEATSGPSQNEGQETDGGDTELGRREGLLNEYMIANPGVSRRQIYEASNSGIHKPEFYKWLKGRLSADSATCISFERFLRAKKTPIRKGHR